MSGFGFAEFRTVEEVEVELLTAAYGITGTIRTPFRRVAEILNQLPGGHLTVEGATIIEHAVPSVRQGAASALVAVDEVIVIIAPGLVGEASAEMRILKDPAHAVLSIPPFRLEGTIHVPVESRPVDGLLNIPDRFLPMTDATLVSVAHPELDREVPILALRRDRAHVIVVGEPDDLPTRRAFDAAGSASAEPEGVG